MKTTVAVAAVLHLLLLITGCSSTTEDEASAARGYNEADVQFASTMIQHHAQALQMVDMTMGRDLDPAVARLTEQIRAAQAPEIETMVDWLHEWDEPVPETVRDHANAHGDGGDEHTGADMSGMLSQADLEALEKARGKAFETLWLQMMIEHHEGAVEMAQVEQEDGTFAPAVGLAERIERTQTAEIETMEGLLGS